MADEDTRPGPETNAEPEPKPQTEPSDSLCMFGTVLKGLREHAGLSREEFGRLVGFSKHTIASIEQGRRIPDWDFVMAADAALGYTDVLHEAFKKVCEQPSGLAAWFRRWAWYERRAVSLYTYECRLVPGLLQTDAYATCVFTDQMPPLDDDQIATRLSARKERQRLLHERPNAAYHFLLEEQLFLRRTGGKQVTKELIEHVLALTQVRNIEIQLMPLMQEHHAGLGGTHAAAGDRRQNMARLLRGPGGRTVRPRPEYRECAAPALRTHALASADPSGLDRSAGAAERSSMSTPDLHWFKSTYSSGSGDDCVEVALDWRKSSYSSSGDGDCVEIATCPTTIHIRDSKNPQGPQLTLSPTAWADFVPYAARG